MREPLLRALEFYGPALRTMPRAWPWLLGACCAAYLVGSIPFAYLIVRAVTGKDVTQHGTGNVGAMNVRRITGSWGWFTVAMVADGIKGLMPTLTAVLATDPAGSVTVALPSVGSVVLPSRALLQPLVVISVVMGHNWSLWMAVIEHRFQRTGKGLAAGAGALIAYDWRYAAIVLAVGLSVIAITRYLLAGQVAAAVSLTVASLALGAPDWPFCLLMSSIVYAAHHRRFMGLLRGAEPAFYVDDRAGPRG